MSVTGMSVEGGGGRAWEPQRKQREQTGFRLISPEGEYPEPVPAEAVPATIQLGPGSAKRPGISPWASHSFPPH